VAVAVAVAMAVAVAVAEPTCRTIVSKESTINLTGIEQSNVVADTR